MKTQARDFFMGFHGMTGPLKKDELNHSGQFADIFPLVKQWQLIAANDPIK